MERVPVDERTRSFTRCKRRADSVAAGDGVGRITEAQRADEWDMNGHAAKAKELLDQANTELKAAAEAANQNKK